MFWNMRVASLFLFAAAEVVESKLSVNDPSLPFGTEACNGGGGKGGKLSSGDDIVNKSNDLNICMNLFLLIIIMRLCWKLKAREDCIID